MTAMKIKLVKTILALQPLFPIPVYFSVLTGHHIVWLSLIIAIIPLGVRYWHTHHIIKHTPFDIPIIIFICGVGIGFIVSPYKAIAAGALSSALASILVYYGIVTNSTEPRNYWLWTAGMIYLITLLLCLWFLSQSIHRVLFFNEWAFNLFSRLPKTSGPVLQLNTIGALLAIVIPPLFAFALFQNWGVVRIVSLILFLFFAGMLFLSDSGAGWLAVIISLSFILVCWQRRFLWLILPVLGFFIATIIIFYKKETWLRATFSTNSLMSRIRLWQNTLLLLKGKASFTGLGLGAWLEVYGTHYGSSTAIIVHNSYLQLYCDTGMLGFIAMILAAIIFIRLSVNLVKSHQLNSRDWIGIGIIGSFIAGTIFAVFDTTTSVTYVIGTGYIYLELPLLWIAAAMISVISFQFVRKGA
jgi:O-antigen ligase